MTHLPLDPDRRHRALRVIGAAAAIAALTLLAACGATGASAPAAAGTLDLRQLPWAEQPDGAPSIRDVPAQPSLSFAPGTTYSEALTALLTSARRTGQPPAGTTIREPLPAEVVYVAPDAPGIGIRLSLTAPWGWEPATGAVRAPSIALPGSLDPAEVGARIAAASRTGALPEGATVDVPQLPQCQIARGSGLERPACD